MTTANCPKTGDPKRSCKCPSCIGRRNRRAGARKASAWWTAMGAQPEKWKGRAANEETRTAEWRAEIKSGQQVERLAASWAKAAKVAPTWASSGRAVLLTFPPAGRQLVIMKVSTLRALFAEGFSAFHTKTISGQLAKVWHTAYEHAREQSDAATLDTDGRPFVFGVMPVGTSDGFAVFDSADGDAVGGALAREWAKA